MRHPRGRRLHAKREGQRHRDPPPRRRPTSAHRATLLHPRGGSRRDDRYGATGVQTGSTALASGQEQRRTSRRAEPGGSEIQTRKRGTRSPDRREQETGVRLEDTRPQGTNEPILPRRTDTKAAKQGRPGPRTTPKGARASHHRPNAAEHPRSSQRRTRIRPRQLLRAQDGGSGAPRRRRVCRVLPGLRAREIAGREERPTHESPGRQTLRGDHRGDRPRGARLPASKGEGGREDTHGRPRKGSPLQHSRSEGHAGLGGSEGHQD